MSSSGTIRRRPAERGFVLATTLLVTTLLTVMLAASFLLVSAEQRTTDNSFGTARALALAQAGLQNYFAQSRGLSDTSSYDSTRITLVLGYANVVATRLRPSGASSGSPLALWVVRSTGIATSPVMAGQTQGLRTIAQFAQLNQGLLPARAALVALNGVKVVGAPTGLYPISGQDLNAGLCTGNPGGAAADTFGLSVPSGLYSDTGTTPVSSRYGIRTVDGAYPSYSNLYDTTHVDWAGLLAGNFLPDYTIPPGSWPTPGGSTYLVAYVPGNVTIPAVPGSSGMRGMLVVQGNVTVSDKTHWDGIILAGGYLSAPAGSSYQLHGMVVTGLNRSLGVSVPKDTVYRGAVRVQWTWCYTQSSINSLSSLVPITNAWVDTWTTY